MLVNQLKNLTKLGQSVWYDYIRRDLYQGPDLRRLIEDDGLRGMTSNPTIFEKAITETTFYDEDIVRHAAKGATPAAILESLTIADVRGAADAFQKVFVTTQGDDGFASGGSSRRRALPDSPAPTTDCSRPGKGKRR
jgi:transaldolase